MTFSWTANKQVRPMWVWTFTKKIKKKRKKHFLQFWLVGQGAHLGGLSPPLPLATAGPVEYVSQRIASHIQIKLILVLQVFLVTGLTWVQSYNGVVWLLLSFFSAPEAWSTGIVQLTRYVIGCLPSLPCRHCVKPANSVRRGKPGLVICPRKNVSEAERNVLLFSRTLGLYEFSFWHWKFPLMTRDCLEESWFEF